MSPAATNQRRPKIDPLPAAFTSSRKAALLTRAAGERVVLGDDGIERYSIDEWRCRFGPPPALHVHYDAVAE